MPALSPQDLEALRRFSALPEGRLLVSWLQDRLEGHDRKNRRAIGEELYRGQGRAIEIEEVLDLLGGANAPGLPRPAQPPKTTQKLPIVNHMAT